jgi:2-polyprenyl-3-methyl-5-hydroxy-6-metoxy-1,4-benzoquinol methylase
MISEQMDKKDHYHKVCLLCGSSKLKNIFGDDHFITRCSDCSFVFCRQIATPEVLKEFYDNYPIADEYFELTKQRYISILEQFEPYRKTGKILEIGCGESYFLDEARLKNWKTYGTEISVPLLEKAIKKNHIIYDSLEKIPESEFGQFDIIISLEVIEHLPDPKYFVAKFEGLVRTGGALYMTTPNFNSLARHILGKNWNNIVYPEHLCYFTNKTMKMLLTRFNFKEKYTKTEGISPSRFAYTFLKWKRKDKKSDFQYDYNERDRNFSAQIDKKILLSHIKKATNSILNLTNTGESLKVFYVKK